MTTCSKQFSITVEPAGVFDDLVWGPGIYMVDFAPSVEQPGVLEGEWNGNEIYELGGFGVQNHPSLVDNTGSLTYTGAAVVCNLHLNIIQFTLRAPYFDPGTSNCHIIVTQDAVPLLNVNISIIAAPGVFDFAFTINAGVNSLIQVRPYIDNPSNGVRIEFTATLTPA